MRRIRWPLASGDRGDAVSLYDDAALVGLSDMPVDEPLDNLVVWRARHHSVQFRELWSSPAAACR
jgi:hypothetical protein